VLDHDAKVAPRERSYICQMAYLLDAPGHDKELLANEPRSQRPKPRSARQP
jgi:hypothetical protein